MSSIKNPEALHKRLMMDIEGVLKTCVAQKVHTLVTGASGMYKQRCIVHTHSCLHSRMRMSGVAPKHTLTTIQGCGAFCHDPYREAALWEEALQKPEYSKSSLRKVLLEHSLTLYIWCLCNNA